MKERPIIFSDDMVRAIREGRKTQTRRVVKPQPDNVLKPFHAEARGSNWVWMARDDFPGYTFATADFKCHYGQVGDRLWVRERHCHVCGDDTFCFPADGFIDCMDCNPRPAFFLPRYGSRITLEITDLRVERLRDISEVDATAEGAEPILVAPDGGNQPHVEGFMQFWDNCYPDASYAWKRWDANPWVWVIEFKKV